MISFDDVICESHQTPKKKFICDALKGPFEKLQEDKKRIVSNLADVRNELEGLRKKIVAQTKVIEDLEAKINESGEELKDQTDSNDSKLNS